MVIEVGTDGIKYYDILTVRTDRYFFFSCKDTPIRVNLSLPNNLEKKRIIFNDITLICMLEDNIIKGSNQRVLNRIRMSVLLGLYLRFHYSLNYYL